jgi:hydrogenase 3 maturation protease
VNASDFLKDWLRGAERLAVVGAGSTLRADDAAGMEVVTRLMEAYPPDANPHLLFCPGETAPENFSGKIRAFNPTHLLVVDAGDMGLAPGEIAEIPAEKVGGPAFLSHMLPLKVLINYLVGDTGAKSALIGIQYQSLEFDAPMTPEIAAAVDELCDALRCAIGECWKEQ